MKYLFDTDVIVDHFRGVKRIDDSLVEKGAVISLITYGELMYGAEKSGQKNKQKELIRSFVEKVGVEIINIDKKTIKVYAELKAKLEIQGQRLDEFDLLIASTALVNELTLVTRNLRHYKRIPNLEIYS